MEYPVAQAGGVEVLVTELVKGLAAEFSIVLVSDDDQNSLAEAGLSSFVTGHFRWRFGQGGAKEARELAAKLKQAGAALAHFHFGGTWVWGSRVAHRCPVIHTAQLGIPVVITNHLVHPPMEGFCGAYRPLWQKLSFLPFVWVNRMRVLAAAKCEFAVSIADRDVERKLFWPLRNRISHMYHSKLDEAAPGGGLPADARAPVVLALGTIGPRKGQRILVEAFDRIAGVQPGWVLRIVGRVADQEYYDSIRTSEAAERLGERLQFAGKLPDAAIPGELDRASIFAMPSLSEGLGLSLQEALFRGCACLGTRVGGIPELIEHDRTGLLVPPNDPVALAETLRKLMADPVVRRRLAENGRASILAKGMTRQRMVRQHAELYRRLLAEQRPSSDNDRRK
jgi:glycosyltransferase involved in cell wall biosynthesis